MKVTNEKIENSQAFLTIEMESAEVEQSLEEAYRRLVKKANVPGFRRGKVPRAILERYVGRQALLEEALEHLIPQAYEKAIKEQEIEAIAEPQIEVTQTDPLLFKAIVPLKPKIKLGDYHRLQLEPEPAEVSEDNVNGTMEQLRHQHATWEPVERAANFNDLVVLDIESDVEGKPFINQKGLQYLLRDTPLPVPGFAEELVGMSQNEDKEFKLGLPQDYPRGELVGKEAHFKVKVTEIKKEILPELNDELARVVNADYQTLDLLREQVSANLKLRAEEKAKADFEERVIDTLADLSEIDFPPVLVELEVSRMLNQRLAGGDPLQEDKIEALREELRPSARMRVTRSLVLGKIVAEEKIEVSDAEIDAEIENLMKSATEKREELGRILKTPQARESIGQTKVARKAIERLVEIAQGAKDKTGEKEAK